MTVHATTEAELIRSNREFYEPLWRDARLVPPERFNTWPLVQGLAASFPRRLEVAPGLRPRLPLEGTQFLDLSHAALRQLKKHGARTAHGLIGAMPFADASFDFVCAFDIVEHVLDDNAAFAEIARVTAPGGALLLSVPLHESAWTAFDDFVGHCRRYETGAIVSKLAAHGFTVERSAVYGMQPSSPRLLAWGQHFLTTQRDRAMWWYNRVFMPLGLRFAGKLALKPGMIDDTGVDEILLVCKKTAV
jgi:SAM-dependent methyltransferase